MRKRNYNSKNNSKNNYNKKYKNYNKKKDQKAFRVIIPSKTIPDETKTKTISIKDQKDGTLIPLFDKYILWCHDIMTRNWTVGSYKKLCDIDNVCLFWQFFNNFSKMGFQHRHFFLMKEGIFPTWEHKDNNGLCSFKTDTNKSISFCEMLGVYMVCNQLMTEKNEIVNGISFSPKKDFVIIKIWINKDIDISKIINPEFIKRVNVTEIKYRAI
jgi:hypothetical protein